MDADPLPETMITGQNAVAYNNATPEQKAQIYANLVWLARNISPGNPNFKPSDPEVKNCIHCVVNGYLYGKGYIFCGRI